MAGISLSVFLIFNEFMIREEGNTVKESKRICKIFQDKENTLANLVDSVISHIEKSPEILENWAIMDYFNEDDDELEIAVTRNSNLVFWSSSQIAFQTDYLGSKEEEGLIHLPMGWYYKFSKQAHEYKVHGYLLIKREFPYRNHYIKSSFQNDFDLQDEYQVQSSERNQGINIYRNNGNFLFSLFPTNPENRYTNTSRLTEVAFFILVFLLLNWMNVVLKLYTKISVYQKFLISFLLAVAIYLIFDNSKVFEFIVHSKLFSPEDFAFSNWLPSLGSYILLSLLMFYLARAFYIFFDKIRNDSLSIRLFSFLFVAIYFSISAELLKILLLNSDISLTFFRDLKFSTVNLYAFFSLTLQILGFIIILLRLHFEYCQKLGKLWFITWGIGSLVIGGLTISSLMNVIAIVPTVFFILLISILVQFGEIVIKEYKYTFLLGMSILCSSYINFYAQDLVMQKKTEVMDLWAEKLSSERDPGAETFLSELDARLRKDTVIQSHLTPPYKTLESYFQNNYFTGFWRNYNLQITVCSPEESVFITDENKNYPCFSFFDNLRKSKGILVSGSNFYFMDRVNGRISYLGQLDLQNTAKIPLKIFIELNSKVIPEGKGYPELLLDEHASRESQDGGYSYAKYYDGELVDRGGDFQYSMKLPMELIQKDENFQFTKNEYRHYAYKRSGNNYIIVSVPELTIYEWISTLPYLFLFFFITGGILIVYNGTKFRFSARSFDFREKIQLTLILSLLGVMTIIGVGLLFYNSNKLLKSMQENLNDKLSSVTSELSIRIGAEPELTLPIRDFLNEQLIVLSDILRTDINLYDLNGKMFATSRSEIYDRGLLSRRMNPVAYREIAVKQRNLFLHDENLGVMKFLSAYSPFYNQKNQLIGYLNLPYFTKQDDFSKQVSEFIITFSNLYIILIILSLIIAVIISQKLTAPLLQIENHLKGIQLGKKNAKIEYAGEDEIGRLALEYNKKVDELALSAELLARSERESAWQEMARQVAHEINNPLTPMKLSIQYLQRLKQNSSDNFDDYFSRVSSTLVEQIDALSLIASTFSDFTKMPGTQNELFDLVPKVKELVLLFENHNNITITFEPKVIGKVEIVADKNQLGRAIINLIKNAIQAIPREMQGVINIDLYKEEDWACIEVADNGMGIPSELHEKLFEPSFTTKSSGMGLGLAITKRIIENFSGEITFQSDTQSGTTFKIRLPLAPFQA